jgi:predicted dehydrogenase
MTIAEKILVIGEGSAAKRHLKMANRHYPSSNIAVLVREGKSWTDELHGEAIFSIEEALSFKPDIIIFANPATERFPILSKLVSLNCKFIFEKPIAHDYATAEKIASLLKLFKREAIVTYQVRHDFSLHQFRKLIEAGELGKMLNVDIEVGQFLPDWRPNRDYRKSVTANQDLGGGVLLELSHEIDYALWLFGTPSEVTSKVSKVSNFQMDVEDYASAILAYEDNSVVRLSLDCFRREKTRTCIARFENGTIKWDGLSQKITIFDVNENMWKDFQENVNNAHANQWIDIVRFAESGISSSSTVNEAKLVLSLVESIKKSSAEKRSVPHGVINVIEI